jgi:ankyrin repeat protein
MSNPSTLSQPSLPLCLAPLVVAILIGCGGKKQARVTLKASHEVKQEVVEFHQVVENGSLDELKQALERGVDVNAPGHVDRTALMVAIAVKNVDKMNLLLEHGADLELTDKFNDTALRHAVSWDFASTALATPNNVGRDGLPYFV